MYLTSMMRQLRSGGTMTDPSRILALADAATKAVTVDDGLDSVAKLAGLADQLKNIQPDRLTTVTMPYAADPSNPTAWVIPMPGDAERLFAMVRGDVPLDAHGAPVGSPSAKPSAAAAPSPTAAPSAPVSPDQVHLTVENGSGVAGRASSLTAHLRALGFTLTRNGFNAPQHQHNTTLSYPSADLDDATAVAGALHLPSTALHEDSSAERPTLVIGADWAAGGSFPVVVTPSAGAVPTTAALQAGNLSKCAKVNPEYEW
jgi:hypothetical protein